MKPPTQQTIFIVEDNRHVQESLVMLIEDEPDLRVCGIAETATKALDAIPNLSPDLVLTDLSLPGMSGIDFIKHLRILKPGQRVVVLSGCTDSICRERAIAAGAAAYILKGDVQAMMEVIRQVLDDEMYLGVREFVHSTT